MKIKNVTKLKTCKQMVMFIKHDPNLIRIYRLIKNYLKTGMFNKHVIFTFSM